MKTSSAKAKGRRAQQLVRDELLVHAPQLTENDVRSTSMGAGGVDILLSEAALDVYPFAIEVKCQESLNIWAALEQAEEHAALENLVPLVCFKRNKTHMYAALPLCDLIGLLNPARAYNESKDKA